MSEPNERSAFLTENERRLIAIANDVAPPESDLWLRDPDRMVLRIIKAGIGLAPQQQFLAELESAQRPKPEKQPVSDGREK